MRRNTILRRVVALLISAFVLLQASMAAARAVDFCSPQGCEDEMVCATSPCPACAALPSVAEGVRSAPLYVALSIPAFVPGSLPDSPVSEIWRPPRIRV